MESKGGASYCAKAGVEKMSAATSAAALQDRKPMGLTLLPPASCCRRGCAGAAAAAIHDRRLRRSVVVEVLVPDVVALVVDPRDRLVEQPRLRISLRHRSLD